MHLVLSCMNLLELLLIISTMADFMSTELALSAGAYEVNPLMQARSIRVAASVGHVVGSIWASRRIRPGNPVLANLVLLVPIVGRSAAAGWNIGVYYRVRW